MNKSDGLAETLLETASRVLIRSFFFAFILLLAWFILLAAAGDFVFGIHGYFFKHLTRENFEAAHYTALAIAKFSTFCLLLLPYLVCKHLLKKA